jgi:hypothetical protein
MNWVALITMHVVINQRKNKTKRSACLASDGDFPRGNVRRLVLMSGATAARCGRPGLADPFCFSVFSAIPLVSCCLPCLGANLRWSRGAGGLYSQVRNSFPLYFFFCTRCRSNQNFLITVPIIAAVAKPLSQVVSYPDAIEQEPIISRNLCIYPTSRTPSSLALNQSGHHQY